MNGTPLRMFSFKDKAPLVVWIEAQVYWSRQAFSLLI